METPEVLDSLFASRDSLQEQRELLGAEFVDPMIQQLDERILSGVPKPSDQEIEVHAGWQKVTEVVEAQNLVALEAPPEIAAAIKAVERYQGILQRLGTSGLSETLEPTAPVSAPEPTPAAAPQPKVTPVVAPTAKRTAPSAKAAAKPTKPASKSRNKQPTPEVAVDSKFLVVISDGEHELKPQKTAAPMYIAIAKAIAESKDGSVDTTAFIRQKTGTTSTELQLVKSGTIAADPQVDYVAAKKMIQQFYRVLGVFKDHNLIDHTPGAPANGSSPAAAGVMRSFAPITFSEENGQLRIEMAPRPYQVEIDLYRQSIDNGRGRNIEFDVDNESFLRISQALGAIAIRLPKEHAKFTRADIAAWVAEHYPAATFSPRVTDDLREVIDGFNGEFPLAAKGRKGGAHFSWKHGTKAETVGGWPEKPQFEDPIYVSIGGDGAVVTIDGVDFTLLDYNKSKGFLHAANRDVDALSNRTRALFETLSLIVKPDEIISSADIARMIYDETASRQLVHTTGSWLKTIVDKLNGFTDQTIVNRRNRNGVLIDLNRRIVLREGGQDQPGDSTTEIPVETTTPVDVAQLDNEADQSGSTDPEDAPAVSRHKTAEEVVLGMETLDDNIRKRIYGRLVKHGKFNPPRRLEEAAYLLKLLSDAQVMAEVREQPWFPSDDATTYNRLIERALYACYIRTLSWGSFEELLHAVNESSTSPIPENVLVMTRSFNQNAAYVRSTDSTNNAAEHARNEAFLHDALEQLRKGIVPNPRSPQQAIGLLELFRAQRVRLAVGKTRKQIDALDDQLAEHAAECLGWDNVQTLLESRSPRRSDAVGRAVQTSGGRETILRHTDANRYEDNGRRGRRRGRKPRPRS